jgi:hypothetical protein
MATTVRLPRRPAAYSLPAYSLTGDLLGFLRCGLQYRYTRIGQLPSTRPVQMWFGQFIHGVLEEAFRRFDAARKRGETDLPPWSNERIAELSDLLKNRLGAQGLYPWNEDVEKLGYRIAKAAINDLGPHLFPLIHRAEVRLTGARALPLDKIPPSLRFREADRYEMVGVIDVITHVQLSDPRVQGNELVKLILKALPPRPPGAFELIIDYKGMRRPPLTGPSGGGPSLWDIYGWQVRTYSHLRSTHADSLPVLAGVILYVNELLPTRRDIERLRKEIKNGQTDVVPEPGSVAERLIREWRDGDDPPDLPAAFRLARAVRVVEVSPATIQSSLEQFDGVVARIETCRAQELRSGRVLSTWEKNASDESTCTACDSRTFCPSYKKESQPQLPAVRARA